MKKTLMAAALIGAVSFFALPASAQSQESLRAELQAALTGNDLDAALIARYWSSHCSYALAASSCAFCAVRISARE